MKKDLTTLFTGRQVTFLPEVDSTNTYLAGILRSISMPEGSVIRAVKQTAGRGQKDTIWESEGGKNLLVSFLFYPAFISPHDIFILNKTFTLGVFDFVSKYLGKKVSIKWPNDIYWKNKKISGILIENSISSTQIGHTILGIGVNINQVKFSQELINPVSFSIVKKKQFNLEELFNELCAAIEERYLQLKNGDRDKIDSDYESVLFSKGKLKRYEDKDTRFKAKILGVDANGKILLQTEKGELKKYETKDVKFVDL